MDMNQSMNKKKKYYVAALTKLRFDHKGEYNVNNFPFKDNVNNSEKTYEGSLTNEAPTYCFFDMLLKEKILFDKIVLFVTSECETEKGTIIDNTSDENKQYENRNTKDYFKIKLKEYLTKEIDTQEKLDILKKYIVDSSEKNTSEMLDEYISSVLDNNYIEIPPERDNDSLYKSIMKIMDKGEDYSNVEIYYDITGGLRLPQFVSMLLIHAMEDLNATVKSVIYADITQTPKAIIDCTSNYKISSIFSITEGLELNKRLTNLGINEKTFTEEELKEFDDLNKSIHKNTLTASNDDKEKTQKYLNDVAKKSSNSSGLQSQGQHQAAKKTLKVANENNPFIKFKNESNTNEIIKNFNENLFKAFYCIWFLDLSEDCKSTKFLTGSVKYAFQYYLDGYEIKTQKGFIPVLHSVIDIVKQMLEELANNPALNAIDLYNQKLDISNPDYNKYDPLYPNALNKRIIKQFETDCESYLNSYWTTCKNTKLDVQALLKSEILYSDYGFPFYYSEKYPFGNNSQGPRMFYIKNVEILCEKIDSEWKNTRNNDYENYKSYLTDIKENHLFEHIPFKSETAYWKFDSNISNITYGHGSIVEFMTSVMQRLEKVRPYRNAIAHNLNNAYNEPAAIEKMAEEIKTWIDEYVVFAEDYMNKNNKTPREYPEEKKNSNTENNSNKKKNSNKNKNYKP